MRTQVFAMPMVVLTWRLDLNGLLATTRSSRTITTIERSRPVFRRDCTASADGWASCGRCRCFGTPPI